jgi:Flp pilus assembly protein TadG
VALAIVFPLALLMIVAIIQAALWWHVNNIVSTAAQEGADAGRQVSGNAGTAEAAARSFLERAGGGMIDAPRVHVDIDAEHVQVTVSADVVHIIPGVDMNATATARASKERFTTP